MSKELWVILADGFEEVEALTPVDCLRRAGAVVKVLSLGAPLVTGARGIVVKADDTLANCFSNDDGKSPLPDGIILPGGLGGAKALAASSLVGEALCEQDAAGGIVAAICAAPALVLAPRDLLEGRRWTCYPGMEEGVAAG